MTREIYFSTDIESDGPLPGPNSMLSYGSAAFTDDGKLITTFTENLALLPGAQADPGTAEWWQKPEQKTAWESCRKDPQDPTASMKRYVAWVKETAKVYDAKPAFVAYPAGFDFLFMYTYMIRFAGESPFSFSAIDIKTYAMAVLGTKYRDSTKKNMPKSWFPETRHNHVAIDDAIEQGQLFINMMKDASNRRSKFSAVSPGVGKRGSDV